MDIVKAFKTYHVALKAHNDAASGNSKKTSLYEAAKISLKANYIDQTLATKVIDLYNDSQSASEKLDVALLELQLATIDLLAHLEVINYVPVILHAEKDTYMVEAKKSDSGNYLIEVVGWTG